MPEIPAQRYVPENTLFSLQNIKFVKVHIFWEEHKNMTKSSRWFDVY